MADEATKQSIIRDATLGKVSGGFPSLDAMKRYVREVHDFKKMETDQAQANAERGRASLFTPDGELDPTKPEQMRGRAYTSEQVMKKLKALQPRLHFERSINNPDLIGIYIQHPNGEYRNGLMHLMGMPAGTVTQYSIRRPDPEGKRMLIQQRGWMKLLVDLSKIGVINLEAARRKFKVTDVSHNFAVLTGARRWAK